MRWLAAGGDINPFARSSRRCARRFSKRQVLATREADFAAEACAWIHVSGGEMEGTAWKAGIRWKNI